MINEKKINADPASGCNNIRKTGVEISNITCIKYLFLLRYISLSCRYFAIARTVPYFANSAGCSPNKPKSNHAFAPPTSFPKINTKMSKTLVTIYIRYPILVKILLSMININTPVKIDKTIKNNCLPYSWLNDM